MNEAHRVSRADGVWAKDQPPYLPLPAFTNERETITCWSLTWRERLTMLLHGRLWLRQLNFGQPLQPIAPSLEVRFGFRKVPLGNAVGEGK